MFTDFEKKDNILIHNDFLKNGYVIKDIDKKLINKISDIIFKILNKNNTKTKRIKSFDELFNNLHKYIENKKLNSVRVKIISEINKDLKVKKIIYNMVKSYLDIIVGNELAIQKTLNLSIQYPNDKSSLLDIHSDTFSGESPFQIVVWIPLVNVEKTKSMFIIPQKQSLEAISNLKNYEYQGFNKIFKKYKSKAKWLKVNYGQVLIFTPNLLHGNIINKTKETRMSLNIRFKSLFSPYNNVKGNDRKLGSFYFPLNMKAASKIALKFKYPKF